MRAAIPIPMLLVRTFQPLHPMVTEAESVSVFKKCFVRGHHLLLVGQRAAHIEPVVRGKVKCRTGQELGRILSETLVDADPEDRRPLLVPTGTEADTLHLSCAGVVEKIDVIPDSKFVHGVFSGVLSKV